MKYFFNANDAVLKCSEWIKEKFEEIGPGCNAVIGISGGKDSSVAAAICVKALGRDRVFGVLMPNGIQSDIDYSKKLCEFLQIKNTTVNIKNSLDAIYDAIDSDIKLTDQSRFNLPPRIRMSVLYAISQSVNGRVINTCNLSEDWVGYSTRYGDSVGDISPLSCFTVAEVIEMGRALGLPEEFVVKPPSDGLCGKTDEDNLGFTYDTLDKYIRQGIEPADDIKELIDRKHKANLFKLELMPSFKYSPYID